MDSNRRKIIYVDDVHYSLITVKNRLKDKYEVYPAQSSTKLFEILEFITPDLILLDVNMPGVDGFEVINMLKTSSRFTDIPVVFLTAQADKESVFRGLNLGAVNYVVKPFSTADLIEQIEDVFCHDKDRSHLYDFMSDEFDTDKPRILAVDDVPAMLRTIHFALRDLYKVYMLTNPEDLSGFLQNIKPDLFLLDCNMPGMSGFELVPIIRKFPEHKDTPIIFVSAGGTFDPVKMAISSGACDFIIKPVNSQILREKIAKHIVFN